MPSPEIHAPHPDDPVDSERVRRRLDALLAALGDLPKQAARLARVLATGKSKWRRVMRPGRPPGHRERGGRPVDIVLADCHGLALMALNRAPPMVSPHS